MCGSAVTKGRRGWIAAAERTRVAGQRMLGRDGDDGKQRFVALMQAWMRAFGLRLNDWDGRRDRLVQVVK